MSSVYGMGNPLIDIIMPVDHGTLELTGAVAGSMNLITADEAGRIEKLSDKRIFLPGGSCANTLKGIGVLFKSRSEICSPAYTGGVGKDSNARRFASLMEDCNVRVKLSSKDVETGNSHIFVTPDHERTMFTYLGACTKLSKEDVDKKELQDCRFFHTTGYMWDTASQEEAAKESAKIVMASGGKISFDIADPFVVGRYKEKLIEWMPGNVNILFANEEELSALTDIRDDRESMLRAASIYAEIIVLKTGADGCMIWEKDSIYTVKGYPVQPVDTTGAGDSFAAGFIYGLLLEKSLSECGDLANKVASYIVTVEGCDYRDLPLQKFP